MRRPLATADEDRWCAYLGGNELDEPAEVVFYCPACAEWEFKNQAFCPPPG